MYIFLYTQAYKKSNGNNKLLPAVNGKYTQDQMFFIGFAQVCINSVVR